MAKELFTNRASTTVSSGGTDAPSAGTEQTWTVASSASFPTAASPNTQFHVVDPTKPTELIRVKNVSGTTWTVVRGAEGTTPVTHTAGFLIRNVVIASWLNHLSELCINALNFGAVGDGVADDTAAIQAAIDFATAITPGGDGQTGNIVFLPKGTYKISSAILIKNRVHLMGVGRGGTIIKAASGFSSTTTTAVAGEFGAIGTSINRMIELGDGTQSTGAIFHALIENIEIRGDGGSTLVGVFSQQANEQCGVKNCSVFYWSKCGIYMAQGASCVSVRDSEIISLTAVSGAIGVLFEAWGQNLLQNCTVLARTNTLPTGVKVGANRELSILTLHLELCTTGLQIDNNAVVTVHGIGNGSASFLVTTLINIASGAYGLVSGLGTSTNSGGAYVVDANTGGNPLNVRGTPFYAFGPSAVRPAVTGSRGGNAALASLLTALNKWGLITDSTSA